MHTTFPPVSLSSFLSTQRAVWRGLSIVSFVTVAALSGCGGGGGGGGGGSSDSSATSSGVAPTSAWPFPFGMSLASPTALASSSAVISGATGVSDIGLHTTMTTQQAMVTSQADAVATGRLSLASSALVNVSALFDTSARSHASCYGQTVAYLNHDDALGTNGTLPSGEVAIWRDSDDSSTPLACAAAEVNAQTQGLSAQAHQATLLMAALRRMASTDSTLTLPAAGSGVDLQTRASTLLSPLLSGVTVQAASIALNADSSEYTYRLLLSHGSGTSAQTLEITVLHTPNDTDQHYAGVLRLAMGYLSTDASIGCADQMSSGRYKVARLVSLGYNRQDQWLSLRLRAGQYCGNPVSSSDQFGELASTTMSGELDPAVFLASNVRGSTLGWRQGFVRMATDLVLNTQTNDFAYAWQDLPLSGTSHARLFAGHGTLDTSTQSRAMALFHGYTDDISNTDGTMRGMVCNWSGPGSNKTMHNNYQYQMLSLGSTASSWALGTSHIHYAPTNSCNASSTMSFDANGDGTLGGGEGQSFTSDLAVPAGSNDVQDDLIQQGYLSPVLLM